MKERRVQWANTKDKNMGMYFQSMNLQNNIELMRKTPFPANIPVIDLVAGNPPPFTVFDSAQAARWKACHMQFVEAQPNRREGIIAYGSGHVIFRDNPPLVIGAIVKAYAGTQGTQQRDEIMKR